MHAGIRWETHSTVFLKISKLLLEIFSFVLDKRTADHVS